MAPPRVCVGDGARPEPPSRLMVTIVAGLLTLSPGVAAGRALAA